jgi:putative flippase GtrA
MIIEEIIKFSITGGLGTVTNLLIFFVFADILKYPPIPVSIGCFLVSVTQNYFINHIWTFKKTMDSKTSLSTRKWLEFLSGSLLGLLLNITVMNFIISYYALPFKFIAQGCGIAAGMVLNFTASKLFVFRKQKQETNN